MVDSYPGTYSDRFGSVPITIHSDGRSLRTTIRDVMFFGTDLDGLAPVQGVPADKLRNFTLQHGDLCGCRFQCRIPLPVVVGAETMDGILDVDLELGSPGANGGIDQETLRLSLTVEGNTTRSRGRSGWFEDELADIQAALPAGTYMRACINCAFSDYSPYGHGLFGNLACFRDHPREYLSVRSKEDIFRVWHLLTEYVQETHHCPQFLRRQPGTGYRG